MNAVAIDAYAKDLAEELLPYIRRQIDSEAPYYEGLQLEPISDDDIRLLAWESIVDLLYDCNREDIPGHAELRLTRWLALVALIRMLTFAEAQEACREAEGEGAIQSVTALSTSVTYAAPASRSSQLKGRLTIYQSTADQHYRKLVYSLRRFPRWQRGRAYD